MSPSRLKATVVFYIKRKKEKNNYLNYCQYIHLKLFKWCKQYASNNNMEAARCYYIDVIGTNNTKSVKSACWEIK